MNISNDLHSLVRQKLINQNIISNQESILLTPCHYIKLHGKWYSHYIITCQNSLKKFFLKILKNNDSSFHCNNYLKILNNRNGNYSYPLVIVPEFKFNDMYYFITTFIEGISLDCIAQKLTTNEWKLISQKLILRLDELSTIHAPFYSEHNQFTTDDCATILKAKFYKRFNHPFFKRYPSIKLIKALNHCFQILDNSYFTPPTLLHMDIKPANIIYNVETEFITLIDFELARFGDMDYGWTQVLLSGINNFEKEYRNQVIPFITQGRLTLEDALKIPKYQCYIFYQLACNLIYYYDRNMNCPEKMTRLFEILIAKLSKE